MSQSSLARYHVMQEFAIGGSGGWDYLSVDASAHRLYISHGNQVEVRDSRNGDSIGVLTGLSGVHGIALVPALQKGFISNGKNNSILVFHTINLKAGASIPAGQHPDAIYYDPFSQRVFVGNGHSNSLTVIDPDKEMVVATIALPGKPESMVADTGKLYVNIEDKNSIVVIDTKTLQRSATWPLTRGHEPSGLAIDLKTKRLFAGCGNKLLCVVDATNGRNIIQLPIGDECDGVVFDPARNTAFSANGEGNITAVEELNPAKYHIAFTIPTQHSARTIALDPETHYLYLPAAVVKPVATGHPQALPGTFRVLVVGE
ncbi:YncE family protein [Chitinophaga costaii]|uniref:YncE family protein n=1 Tax=Chitinophaga costaii TaxID=1335309 RepID=UPI000F4DBE25|nr:YncE family protein [Chitinophaga costaii]